MPLEGVRVRLRHDRIHAEDCESCVSEDGKVSRIEKQLELEGPELSDEQRQRLEEISTMCPVHRTLSGEIAIESVESFDD
jgi:putative redox protein